jgi:hypothetical protein
MTSFQAEPPTITIRGETTQVRPYGERGASRILAQLGNLTTPEELGPAFLVAFAAIYTLPPDKALTVVKDEAEFNRHLEEADMELCSKDLAALDEYLAGIMNRRAAAQVTVDDSPGKP